MHIEVSSQNVIKEAEKITIPQVLFIHLHTTERCNLKCKYCYNDRNLATDPIYDSSALISFIDSVNRPELEIIFYGGEPLLNLPFIEKVIETLFARSFERIAFHVVTNGTLLGSIPQRLCPFFTSIWVSFDGLPSTIDCLRGKGVHDKIVREVAAIRSIYNGPLVARMTVGPFSTLPDDALYAGTHFDHVFFQIDNTMDPSELIAFAPAFNAALKEYVDTWLRGRESGTINWHADNVLGLWYLMKKHRFVNYYHCSPGVECVTIDSLGRIYSCPEGESPNTHHHKNECFIGCIQDFPQLKAHQRKARCVQCDVFGICGGRCIWTDHDAFCSMIRHTIQLVIENYARIDHLYYEEIDKPRYILPALHSEIVP